MSGWNVATPVVTFAYQLVLFIYYLILLQSENREKNVNEGEKNYKQFLKCVPSSATPSDANVLVAGGQTMHKIHNNSDQRRMFKVKLSNTADYRVTLVFAFVDASSNANIEFIRKSGTRRSGRMEVQLGPAPQDATPELHSEMYKICPMVTRNKDH